MAVLLTGDGAGYREGIGFHADLERMRSKNWAIEVIAWEGACGRLFRRWVESVGVFIALERFYDQVTFIERGRLSKPLSLKNRQTAAARLAQNHCTLDLATSKEPACTR